MESYQVKYQTLGEDVDQLFPSADLTDGTIVLTEVDNKMVEGRIKYLGYEWSPWTASEKTEVSFASSLLSQLLRYHVFCLHCLVSEGRVNRTKQGDAGSRGDCRSSGGGDPRHGYLLHCEEEEKVTK